MHVERHVKRSVKTKHNDPIGTANVADPIFGFPTFSLSHNDTVITYINITHFIFFNSTLIFLTPPYNSLINLLNHVISSQLGPKLHSREAQILKTQIIKIKGVIY